MPLYLDARVYFSKKKHSSFVYFNRGTSLRLIKAFDEGLFIEIGLGFKLKLDNGITFMVSLSRRGQDIRPPGQDPNLSRGVKAFSGTGLNLGLLF